MPPTEWTTVRVDLWALTKGKPPRIQALSLAATGGGAIFDQIVLGRTPADLDRLYALVKEKKGRVDVLFANAGAGKFAPLGKRGMFTSRQGFGVDDYFNAANDQSMLMVLIEDIAANIATKFGEEPDFLASSSRATIWSVAASNVFP